MSGKRIGQLFALALVIGFVRPAFAGWGDKGFEAYSLSDYELAAKLWAPFEEQEAGDVLTRIGWMYKFGEGLEIDLQKATVYFRKAAHLGDPWAQFNLGYVYHFGEGNVEQNLVEAYEWYTLALEGRYERSKTRINQLEKIMTTEQIAEAVKRAKESPYRPRVADDQIVAESLREAKEMFQQEYMIARNKEIGDRAMSGEVDEGRSFGDMFEGMFELLGDMPMYMASVFETNVGGRNWSTVPKNVTKKAPENTSISDYYVFGEKLKAKYALAAENFEKAAERGDPTAAANLGYLYFFGNGVPLDILKARMWFQIAFDGGIDRAQNLITEVDERMKPEQIEEAVSMAKSWNEAQSSTEDG